MKLDLVGLALALVLENDPYFPQHGAEGTCANSSREKHGPKCKRDAVKGHIYCDPCRLAVGGYNRYNSPRALNATLRTKTQE